MRLSQAGIIVACAALVAVGLVFQRFDDVEQPSLRHAELISSNDRLPETRSRRAEQSTSSVAIQRVRLGETLSTGPREKRRVTLLDGSVLSINEQSRVTISGERRVKLLGGEVFVEVTPTKSAERFVVETPHRTVTALGTKFVVKAQKQATNVVVTQGQVQVSGVEEVIPAGQELIADLNESKSVELRPAKRSAYVVEWVKDLLASAGSIVVPTSEHAGGTVTVVDPNGQEMKLSLRKFHVDVHIEEGFARTTIDQTYFNHTWQQLEGTFRFLLPADASLSRLAMYVNGKLMEGGMVERDYGRNVFEQIRHTRRDPALLEWVDGSTFQMRVFPLEARQEKRILLSYTQRLPNDYGKSVYRFPAGHDLEGVREWSTQLRVKGEAGAKWYSPSHLLNARDEQGDLVIDGREEYAALDRDLVVEFGEEKKSPAELQEVIRRPMEKVRGQRAFGSQNAMWSICEQDGFQYVMLRYRPELTTHTQRSPRHWVFLVEISADRNDILAETQRQIARVLLENVEHTDTFSIIRAGTQAELFRRKPVECSLENVAAAQKFLRDVAPIGALDLEQALQAVQKQARGQRDLWIVHLGTGIPVLGERDDNTLLRLLPAKARYVGVAVGKRWSKSFMETAANHSGGHVTQINPDEAVAWRAFDLLSTLNAPRLTEITVREVTRSVSEGERSKDAATEANWLLLTNSLAHGQELAAVARFPIGQPLPKSLLITGKLDGQKNQSILEVPNSSYCGHLPRTWARLEIDRLVALGAAEHKPQIIELSKSMYVMSPFTSLLVLETEAMYEQFKVDRGRKDHWAMYPAPAEIPVVADQVATQLSPLDAAKERLKLTQARAKSAQSNYERTVTEKRPANDLQRLDRLNRAEQAEVKLIEREIQRIERENTAAADPVRIAWESVVQRRTAWQLAHYQMVRNHRNFWGRPTLRGGDLGWSDRPMDWSLWDTSRADDFGFQGRFDQSGNGSLDGMWLDLDLPANTSLWSKGRAYVPLASFSIQDLDSVLNLNAVGNLPGDAFGTNAAAQGISFRHPLAINGVMPQSVMGLSRPLPVTRYYSTRIDGEFFDEQRYLRVPILNAYDDYGLIANDSDGTRGAALSDIRRRYRAPFQLPGRLDLDVDGKSDRQLLSDLMDQRAIRQSLEWWWSDADFTYPDINNNFLSYRGFRPSFHRPEVQVLVSRLASWNGPDVDSDGDGFADVIGFDLEPTVLATESLPRAFGQQVVGELGYVTDGRINPLFALDVAPGFGGDWHPTLYGRDRTAALHPLTGVLRDLPSYAPGLQTWPADRLAIVEQAAALKPKRGEVDPEARRLIEKARSLGWERCRMAALGRPAVLKSQTGTAEGGHPTVIADGSGRFVFDREVGEGLKESVINDGTTLWHLYPEIGLGAKRTLSRFHQSAIQSLIPWYVPSADDLSVEADVKTIGERTIRITRRTGTPARREADAVSKTNDGQECPSYAFDLLFAEDGRLSETRVIRMRRLGLRPDHSGDERSDASVKSERVGTESQPTVLVKQTFDADGTVRVFDSENKLVAEAKYERTPIEAPNLVPVTKDLVVLPLPYRSAAGVPVTVPVNLQTNAPDYAKLSEDDALLLLASYFAEARQAELGTFIEQRYAAKGDHRIGLAVLLSSVYPQHALVMNATKQHSNLPLARFLEQFAGFPAQGNLNGTLDAGDSASPFLKRVCEAYNHYSRWATDRATNRERPVADIQTDLTNTLLFIRECRSLDLAAKLLAVVDAALKRTERMSATFSRQLHDATVAIADERGLPAFGRTARIEWLLLIGDDASVSQAKELFRTQLADAITSGGVPELNNVNRGAFVKHFKTRDGQPCAPWGELVLEAARKLAADRSVSGKTLAAGNTQREAPAASAVPLKGSANELTSAFRLIAMARTCVALREPALAAAIFELAIKDQDLVTQRPLNLAALTYAKEAGNWELAEACTQRALADEKLQTVPQLWRDAAAAKRQLRKFREWIEFVDRAYELEFAMLPKTLDLNAFRIDYGNLFNQFDERAAQLAGAKQSEKVAFAHLVQRAAARWRDIDVDDTVACHRTAFLLAKLGLPTAAWNYWTTPLAETPDRSAVWQSFAIAMHAQQRVAVADQAWTTAFACEPTNPELLLQHAQFLRSTRQEHKARELLTKIVNNTWQPRFESTKQQAQQLLTTGGSAK